MEKLEKENKILRQLLEGAIESGFGLDLCIDYDWEGLGKVLEESKDMEYFDFLLYYTERWIDDNEPGGRS